MKKGAIILTSITAAFICIIIGFFIGRNTTQQLRIPANNSIISAVEETNGLNSEKININTATAKELQLLPGIGESIAQQIIDYRETNGPFSTVEDLLKVSGIGDSRLAQIIDYITTGS